MGLEDETIYLSNILKKTNDRRARVDAIWALGKIGSEKELKSFINAIFNNMIRRHE